MRRPARHVQLGSTITVKPARAHTPETSASAASQLSPAPDERQMSANYDPSFHQKASASSAVFWSIYGLAIVVACALFFFYA